MAHSPSTQVTVQRVERERLASISDDESIAQIRSIVKMGAESVSGHLH
jgi:hypothetical protein